VSERRDRSNQRGVALLLVLWIFMVLGVLALDFGRYMRDDAQAALNFSAETRGYYVALAGMNRALFAALEVREQRLRGGAAAPVEAEDADEEDDAVPLLAETPVDGQWHRGEFAGAEYEVRMTDEGGRIPINRVGRFVIETVVRNLLTGGNRTKGMNRRAATDLETVVDSILDWKDIDSLRRVRGAENDYYLSLRQPYRAKNAFLDSPEELLSVRGMTPELFYGVDGMPGLRDVISVHNRSGIVNVRATTPAVVQALLGMEETRAKEIVEHCDPATCLQSLRAEALVIDPRLPDRLGEDEPHTILVEARADVREDRSRATVAAVVELASDEIEGMRVLRWLDRAPWEGALPTVPEAEDVVS